MQALRHSPTAKLVEKRRRYRRMDGKVINTCGIRWCSRKRCIVLAFMSSAFRGVGLGWEKFTIPRFRRLFSVIIPDLGAWIQEVHITHLLLPQESKVCRPARYAALGYSCQMSIQLVRSQQTQGVHPLPSHSLPLRNPHFPKCR